MTFNIRFATPNDGINQWENRKEKVAQTITYYEADICGLQEATKPQIDYLAGNLKDFDWIGVGRDDGKQGGEYSPIFYNSKKLKLITWGTQWLSPTPAIPSKGWDAALPRIYTWAKFSTLGKKKKTFYVINTHYDHIGVEARRNSSKMIAEKCLTLAKEGLPVFFMGDLNTQPEEEPYQTVTNIGLLDTEKMSNTPHFGPRGTFNGFQTKEEPQRLIDFIFFTGKNVEVRKHATLSNAWEGLYSSDHYAILANILLH